MSKSRPSTATSIGTTKVFVDPSVKRFKQPIERIQNYYPNLILNISIAITASAPQDPTCGKLLLLRRRKRGLKVLDPRKPRRRDYELPGGLIQSDDSSVIMAVLRQVEADTGLKVLGVLGSFEIQEPGDDSDDALHSSSEFINSSVSRSGPAPSSSSLSSSTKGGDGMNTVKCLNFVVEVEHGAKAEVRVDSKKYESHSWVDVKPREKEASSSSSARFSLRHLSRPSKPKVYGLTVSSALRALEEYY